MRDDFLKFLYLYMTKEEWSNLDPQTLNTIADHIEHWTNLRKQPLEIVLEETLVKLRVATDILDKISQTKPEEFFLVKNMASFTKEEIEK